MKTIFLTVCALSICGCAGDMVGVDYTPPDAPKVIVTGGYNGEYDDGGCDEGHDSHFHGYDHSNHCDHQDFHHQENRQIHQVSHQQGHQNKHH